MANKKELNLGSIHANKLIAELPEQGRILKHRFN